MGRAVTHQTVVSVMDDWETPPALLEQVMEKYDIHPTLDVCATSQNTKFPKKYFTIHEDALTKQWDEDFFMNPPYSEINQWMQKAYEQHLKHNVTGLILVFAKTGVKWWDKYVEGKAEIHFQQGRIMFLLNGIEPRYCKKCKKRSTEDNPYCISCGSNIPKSSPTYDSVWVIFRKKEK